jgi:protein SCO1
MLIARPVVSVLAEMIDSRPQIGDQCAQFRGMGARMAVSTKTIAVAAAGAIAIASVAIYAVSSKRNQLDAFANCRSSVVMGGGVIGGPFNLTDENGRAVTDKDVLDKPSLVYFGYTFCPDVCPTDMARNAEAVDVLEEQGYDVTPVFISVDPRRDTPEVLKEWTNFMHPRMIGLTGTPDELKSVAKEYRTIFQVPENPTDDNYLVDHMTMTYLMLPGIGFADVFNHEDSADKVAEKTACFLDAAQSAN